MTTNTLHLHSAYFPLWILIVGGIFFVAFHLLKTKSYLKIAMALFVTGVLFSLFTGAMGGASMSKTEELPDINLPALHLHAWTAAVSILSFMLLVFSVWKRKRLMQAGRSTRAFDLLAFFSLLAVAGFLFYTIHIAHQIRL